jgi:hypothetical protein
MRGSTASPGYESAAGGYGYGKNNAEIASFAPSP